MDSVAASHGVIEIKDVCLDLVTRVVTGKMRHLHHVYDAAGIPIDALSCGEPIQYS